MEFAFGYLNALEARFELLDVSLNGARIWLFERDC